MGAERAVATAVAERGASGHLVVRLVDMGQQAAPAAVPVCSPARAAQSPRQ